MFLVTGGYLGGTSARLATAGYGAGIAAAVYAPEVPLTVHINRVVSLAPALCRSVDLTTTINRTVSDDVEVP